MVTAQNRIVLVNEYVSQGFDKGIKQFTNLERQIKGYHSAQERGLKLNKQQRTQLTGLEKQYTRMGGSVNKLTSHNKGLLLSMTKMRWVLVNLAMAGAAVYGAYRTLIKPFIDFEKALAEVRKTTNFSREEISGLGDSLLEMSKTLPITSMELAKIATIAGQLGLGGEGATAVESFTRVVAMMATATEMTAETAATNLAKIAQAFNLPISDVNNLGSAINELSNTTAATSSEISESLKRVGAVSTQLGLSVEFMAALEATLISSGMQANRAATRMRTALARIATDIEGFAKIAGKKPLDFRKMMVDDPEKAILEVISGLNKYGDSVSIQAEATETIGRVGSQAFQTLAISQVKLLENIETSNSAYNEGLSLIKETRRQAQTTAATMTELGNAMSAMVMSQNNMIGQSFKAVIEGMAEAERAGIGRKFLDLMMPQAVGIPGLELLPMPSLVDIELERQVGDLKDRIKELVQVTTPVEEQQKRWMAIMEGLADEGGNLAGEVKYLTNVEGLLEEAQKGPIEKFEKLNETIGFMTKAYDENISLISQARDELRKEGSIRDETKIAIKGETEALSKLNIERERELGRLRMEEDIEAYIAGIKGLGDVTEESYMGVIAKFSEFTKGSINEFDILRNEAEGLFKFLDTKGELELGFSKEDLFSWINAQEAIENTKDATKGYNDEIKDLRTQLSGVGKDLSEVRKRISEVNKEISTIKGRRWNIRGISETNIIDLITRQELEIKKAEFAALGLGTAEEFLGSAVLMTSDEIDAQTQSMKELTDAASDGQSQFEAWKTTLTETIRALLVNSKDLDRDVTDVVRNLQTELLSVTEFGGGVGAEGFASPMEDQLNRLRMAQGIFFGEEQAKLDLSEMLYEDRINGMNASAAAAIVALESEREALRGLEDQEQSLIEKQGEFRDDIDDLIDKLEKLKNPIGEVVEEFEKWKEAAKILSPELKKVWDAMKGGYEGVIGGKLPGEEGFGETKDEFFNVGGTTYKKVPKMQEGGIVNRPTLAMIGESGPEAVIPLKEGGVDGAGGNIQIIVQGYQRDPIELAREVRRELVSIR